MVAKKNKPVIVRRRPTTFIEGEPMLKARADVIDNGADEIDADDDAPMAQLSPEKMLLKLRMSSSRQLPVWSEAKDTLWEKGFEASAKAAAEVETAQIRFRKILDAEAKIRDAEEARAELARLSGKADPGDEDDGKGEDEDDA